LLADDHLVIPDTTRGDPDFMRLLPYRPLLGGLLLSFLIATPAASYARTLNVCNSGCAYDDLQRAIDDAQPGDTILLRGGETFVGHFILPVKDNPSGQDIVIRTDASGLPGPGVRLVPDGYPGANVNRASLARLIGRGGQWKTTPVIAADPGANHYRVELLDVDGIAQEGYYTLLEIGTNNARQATWASVPSNIVLDRLFIHGHPTKGQQRCVGLNGRSVEVLNSFIVNCASFVVDAQAIGAFNSPGPMKINNNYLEGTGENILFGGADPRIEGLVPSDIEIRRNHFSKPVAWRSPILSAPVGAPGAARQSGGELGAAAYYFTVVAVLESGGDVAVSAPSPERSISVSTGDAVRLTWSGVDGADRYRIYAGNAPGGQDRYMETNGAVTSFVYTGANQTWQGPRPNGTLWSVKNLLELKNAQRVLIDGNVLEQLWPGGQSGYAILLTPRNEEGTAPWSVVQDVVLSNNIIRHASGALNILGTDDIRPSQQTSRITVRNNLVYDLSSAWGGASHFAVITRSPSDLTFDHNTVFHEGMLVLVDDGVSYGLTFTNNAAPHNDYGFYGSSLGIGSAALAGYFPDANFRRNAFGGGPASSYPADNFFPDLGTFRAQFVNPDAADFRLVEGSILRGRGTDGKDVGVDFAALASATAGVVAGWDVASGGSTGGAPGGGTGGTDSGGGGSAGTLSPFTSIVQLPGVLQAENFDNGGSGVAYFDSSAGNEGGSYRSTGVDIESTSDAGGGYNVGWMAAGEWLAYSVDVSQAGSYTMEARVAVAGNGGTFHIEVNGVDRTGPLTIRDTGGWQNWVTISKAGVSLNAGQQLWRLVIDSAGSGGLVGNLNYLRIVADGAGGGGAAGSTPYTSAPVLPGVIEAENYDQGGASVAYGDTSSGNAGGSYRSGDVDIESTSDVDGGFNIGWMDAGEWLKYTVTVATAGDYTMDFRVASAGPGGTFHLEVNGVDRTGPLTIPDTGGWQSWATVRTAGISLTAGGQVWRLVIDRAGSSGIVGNLNYLRVLSSGATSTPFGGTAVSLPGVVEAENYDSGGQGVGYRDFSGGNEGGQYRSGEVDIESADDASGGYSVGWIQAGEWLAYTVVVGADGTYDLEFRVASAGSGGSFHLEVDGVDKSGSVSVPDTGGWQSWVSVRVNGVSLRGGTQAWRLVMDRNGGDTGAVGNINYIRITER